MATLVSLLAPRAGRAEEPPFQLFKMLSLRFNSQGHQINPTLTVKGSSIRNAFAHGTREVVITEGLLRAVKDESERAFILAHELAHIALGHTSPTSTQDEIEADTLALTMIRGTDLNPCSGTEVLDRLSAPLHPVLTSISARLSALHTNTFRECG